MAKPQVLDQLQDHWQKIAMFLLWKFKRMEKVTLTSREIQEFTEFFEPGVPTLVTTGEETSLSFQILTAEKAGELVAKSSKKILAKGEKHG
jgi:hypothetical protein